MTEKNSSDASVWKLASFLLAGVLIPILAALLPWTLDKWTPKAALEYSVIGPLSTDKAVAVALTLRNSGKERQSNVEIWLPLDATSEFETKVEKDGTPSIVEAKPVVLLTGAPVWSKKEIREGKTVLTYASIRPGESVSVTAFVIGGTFLNSYELESLRIVSEETIATKVEQDEELDFIFKVGTGLLVLLLVFMIGFGFYYEKLMPVEKKKADLRKQLEKLGDSA